jgi:copper chaperone CopZ
MALIKHTKTNKYRRVIFLNVTKFHVDNLKGSNDIENLRSQLQSMGGVHAVRVDNVADTITVEYEDGLSTEKLAEAVNKFKNVRQ